MPLLAWPRCSALLLCAPIACERSAVADASPDAARDADTIAPSPLVLPPPPGFPAIPSPADNPLSEAKAQLGKKLFFEGRLSRTEDISCGSCHLQAHAFADPNAYSSGVDGQLGTRNAPALINLAYSSSFFWDGGVTSLEEQSIAPVQDPREMDLPLEDAIARLVGDADYEQMFQEAFGDGPNPGDYTRAVASFVRTLVSGDSRYDRYLAGDGAALSAAEIRGERLFMGEKGECFHCHVGFNFTNERFAHNGTFVAGSEDTGRERVTLNAADRGRFKVPTLRNVAVTAPYMHDGSIATLDEVLSHYGDHGRGDPGTEATVLAVDLNLEEQRDVVAFLESLTDEQFLSYPGFREANDP